MSQSRRPRSRRYLLDFGHFEDIPKSKAFNKQFLKYSWEYYSEVAFQRSQIYEALKASLREKAEPFIFNRWQRAVKYRYSLKPLSTEGSKIDPGGRFNIGEIDPSRYSVFSALYVASDKETALDELFSRDKAGCLLNPEDLALSKMSSVTVVSVSGSLESVLDIREPGGLAGFLDLTKNFKLSADLITEARRLGIEPPRLIGTVAELMQTLIAPNWRFMPMQCDVPAVSQIFGQIVMEAGIEAVVYPSVLSHEPCLVIYPQNFANSSAFVEIDDPVPSQTVPKRIDSSSFKNFI